MSPSQGWYQNILQPAIVYYISNMKKVYDILWSLNMYYFELVPNEKTTEWTGIYDDGVTKRLSFQKN